MANSMRVLLDLNVIIDVAQNRAPFYAESAAVLDAAVRREVAGWLAAHSVTTLFYVLTRYRDREVALTTISGLLDVFTVASVGDAAIRRALSWGWQDFEDAVQMSAAVEAGVDYLVTRNTRDFQAGPLPVVQPAALLALLAGE